jgi:LysM repeat protein
MRGKNKVMLTALLITFVATTGMFYYQNVYSPKQDESKKITVLVAKKDIAEGSAFTTDNIGGIKIDKNMVLPNHITKFDDLKGKSSNSDILSNEIVTKPRINGVSDGTKQFSLGIEAKNLPTSIKNGDYVRVYVQTTVGNKIYELFEKKEVVSINLKKSSSGKDSTAIESVDLLLSDKETVSYFDAQKAGNILMVRYNDLTENDTVDIPKYDMRSEELTKLKAEAEEQETHKESYQKEEADGAVKYIVKSGDTFESISKEFNITEDEIKTLNPGVTTLSPGDELIMKQE